jgi:hypothetical protein
MTAAKKAKRGRWWPPWSLEMVGEGFRRREGPPLEWRGKKVKEWRAEGYIKVASMEDGRHWGGGLGDKVGEGWKMMAVG